MKRSAKRRSMQGVRLLAWWLAVLALAAQAFPTLPAPTRMTPTTAGDITFETRTPYDFDVLLGGYAGLPRHRGMGRLVLPAGATAERPVPAVVLVHGSGGLTPGRETEYGALLAANGDPTPVIDYYRPRGMVESTP